MDQYALVALTQGEKSKMTQLKNRYGDSTFSSLLSRERDADRLEKETEKLNVVHSKDTGGVLTNADAVSSLVSALVQLSSEHQRLLGIKMANATEYDEVIAKQRAEIKDLEERKSETEYQISLIHDELGQLKDLYKQDKERLEAEQIKVSSLEEIVNKLRDELAHKEEIINALASRRSESKKDIFINKDISNHDSDRSPH